MSIRVKLVLGGRTVAIATAQTEEDVSPHIRGEERYVREIHQMLDDGAWSSGALPYEPRIVSVMRGVLWSRTYAAPDVNNHVEIEGWEPPPRRQKAPPGTVF